MAKDTAILAADPEGVGPASHLISIFDPSDVGQALHDNGWSNSEAIQLLVDIARDAANNTARERMTAIKLVEDKAEKSLTLAGIIRRVSLEAQQNDGKTKKTLTAEGLQLIKEGAARTLSTLQLLEAGSQTPELIEVDQDDSRTRSDVQAPKHVHSRTVHVPDDNGPTGTGDGRSESGPCLNNGTHGPERTSSAYPTGTGQDDDKGSIQGTNDERGERTSVEPERGIPSSSLGTENQECGLKVRPDFGGTDRPARRTTPYTPGEARRRATGIGRLQGEDGPAGPTEVPPTIADGRPADGDPDTRGPRIAARYLPAALAATGFPGDSTAT